ncbi:MAG: hypothetical protein K2O16_15650, partial [Lachnospiraceae bacterium]|nr:hypothetical protein [Lachnospiraceae bacterium]
NGIFALSNHFLTTSAVNAQVCVNSNRDSVTGGQNGLNINEKCGKIVEIFQVSLSGRLINTED